MAVRSLQHYCLAVPDPAIGAKFYQNFGLEGEERSDCMALRYTGRDQDQVLLVDGPRRQLHHLCLATPSGEFAAMQQALEENGTQLLDPPAQAAAEGLWFHDPEGTLINLRAGEAAPWAGAPEWRINSPGHYRRQGGRGCPPRDLAVKPRRLGHVLTFATNLQRQVDFYTRVLGMRLSDRSEDLIAFLHCPGGSDHHVLAFLAGDRTGLHHASFETANIDEVGLGARQMIAKGYRDGWGFGRHVICSDFFHYICDPWNGLAEYFCDIDYIPADMDWQPKDWLLEDSLYVWGPDVPADFPVNFENPA